ncbi:HpcH/HpaI aldolase/citrate lyase family protein [Rouxiella chamberiensis]|uniref:HpcH/HpaI aldolase/citrate lyase family protein n=1 Tax=Rouxiella chamberiensis TaxID=1513468 RepID=A0ABY7HSR3_9GAMM|nr:HpcH/HpaI aldolase/citrate lyase family protein [Rouxiella chamberiensis]WAT01861.1 HpcH/HpaI aldolase/citrate lyase family protein [Rouxiella chamberiensis]
MTKRLSPYRLGATLYMPATRHDIADIVLKNRIEGLRSIVIDLEDAIADAEVPIALTHLRRVLQNLSAARLLETGNERPLVFIRPRHLAMCKKLVEREDLASIDGLVLPKFTLASLPEWWAILENTHLGIMPTLETEEVFDVAKMRELAVALAEHPCHERVVALRIGGNDLMNVISLRRPRNLTLYDSPMGYVIKMLVAVFGSRDFALTSPVCEHIDEQGVLEKELALDMAHGLVGKTAIHPSQIAKIEQALRVSSADHEDALRILNSRQAVFKSQGAMCEPATHRRWALRILEQAQIYGISPDGGQDGVRLVTLTGQS